MRGDQLYRTVPELTGVGYPHVGFKVAPQEDVAIAKSVVRRHHTEDWAKKIVDILRQRRGEFQTWKKHSLERRLTLFAANLEVPQGLRNSRLVRSVQPAEHTNGWALSGVLAERL